MPLSGLSNDGLKLILFGGKGGVGKTTCAVVTGLYLSGSVPIATPSPATPAADKVLLISTDPAHSISDSLGQTIGSEIKAVVGVPHLSALEISAEKSLSRFKLDHEKEIKQIFATSTNLDEEDIDSAFALTIPGMDEVMGFKTIVDLIEAASYDKFIIDTAPTGHALRLVTLPELLDDWIKVMAKMRWKYRYMIQRFAGDYSPDKGDDFLLTMKKTVKKIDNLLKDPERCEFIAVTIPEDMAILETERLIHSLGVYGIKVKQLVVNNVLESRDCDFCRERHKDQEKYIAKIYNKFAGLNITLLPLQATELKGIASLQAYKDRLFI